MEQPIVIQPLKAQHAAAVSEIHLESQQGTFLTTLGRDFLTVLYSQISQSDFGIGYVGLNDSEVVGFVVGALHTEKLFKEVILKRSLHLGWLVFKQALGRPALLWHSAKTLTYPTQRTESKVQVELLALAVKPAWRNKQVGSQLLQQLVYRMQVVGVDKIAVTVDSKNSGAFRFYRRQGFVPMLTFEMYGRSMTHFILRLRG